MEEAGAPAIGGVERFDIAICGGSFVGLALARALSVLAPGQFRIALIEQRPLTAAGAASRDGRAVALTASVKAMLGVIGIWPSLAREAQPVLGIELTDSALDSPIRPALARLDSEEAPGGEPTAFIVENALLLRSLLTSIESLEGLTVFAPDQILRFDTVDGGVGIALASGRNLLAQLLVAADGQNSSLRSMAGIKASVWPSNKNGIVATIGTELSHDGVARQHFLPAGPFAILPMTGNRVSIVWTEEMAIAKRILRLDREAILQELSLRFGPQLGSLKLLSEPKAYPLTMTLAREFVRPHFALVGDAAHALHWIAGQGLNHGLKDVAALSQTVIEASRLGLCIGAINTLKRYERWRRFDSTTSAFSALALNALFSNDSMALRMLRGSGLRTIDRISSLKTLFMKEAAGLTGELPKLLRGQPV